MIFLLLKHNDEKHKKLTSDEGTVLLFGWGGGGGAFLMSKYSEISFEKFRSKWSNSRDGPLRQLVRSNQNCRVPFPKMFVSSPTLLGIIKISVEKQMDASIRFIFS